LKFDDGGGGDGHCCFAVVKLNSEWFDILVPAYPGLLIVKYKFYSELAKINGRFFRVDNFATVTSRRHVLCQKFTNFIQKKRVKLTCE